MSDANWNKRHVAGKMHETRKAWANLSKYDMILFVGDQESKVDYDEDTPRVQIEIRVPGRRNSMLISLTHMTAQELDTFEEFVTHAISRARPIVETLDRRAREAYENGDDGFERLYRPISQFIDRERSKPEHGAGIPSRPERSTEEHDNSTDDSESNDDGDAGCATSD